MKSSELSENGLRTHRASLSPKALAWTVYVFQPIHTFLRWQVHVDPGSLWQLCSAHDLTKGSEKAM